MRMTCRYVIRTAAVVLTLALVCPPGARAAKGKLEGFQEVPAISSTGLGKCTVKPADGQLAVTLEYSGLKGSVTQAHVHLGQAGVNGGIMFFICTNLGNGPVGTPACPAAPATVTRIISAADIGTGAQAQGLAATDLPAVLVALKKRATYCNVHTDLFPGGEIRTQLK
jgi:hypothetical protein